MEAVAFKRTETLKLLLSKPDVDLSLQDNYGYTAITDASINNNVDCLKLLLLHPKCSRAIVEVKADDGKTAEIIAKSNGYKECEKPLRLFNPISIIEELQTSTQKLSFSALMNTKPVSELRLADLVAEVKSLRSIQREKDCIMKKHKEKETAEAEEFD